ncbi:MAG: cupredoxin domain-containing protein [Candidatus Nitrosotenuis sp.]
MNKTILAGVAIFALLGAILSLPTMQSVDAAESKEKKTIKKDTKKIDKNKDTKKATKSSGKAASEVTVEMTKNSGNEGCEKGNKCYSPFEAKVTKGGTVTWINKDSAAHTATSGKITNGPDGKFDTGLLQSGEKYAQKFDASGKYDYFCLIHPWMKGKVIIS